MDNFRRHGTGKTFAAEDVEGVTYPQVELVAVEDGKALSVSGDTPLPVQLPQERDLLAAILLELRRMNAYFEIITGDIVKDQDL